MDQAQNAEWLSSPANRARVRGPSTAGQYQRQPHHGDGHPPPEWAKHPHAHASTSCTAGVVAGTTPQTGTGRATAHAGSRVSVSPVTIRDRCTH